MIAQILLCSLLAATAGGVAPAASTAAAEPTAATAPAEPSASTAPAAPTASTAPAAPAASAAPTPSTVPTASAAQAPVSLVPTQSWDRYEVLVERNIFSRQRGRRETIRTRVYTPPTPPERYMLLTGVAKEGDVCTAFLEDTRTNAVSKVHVGDTVLAGRVAAITMDAIDYDSNGRVARIAVGGNLGGGTGRVAPPAAAPAAGSAAPAAGSASPAPGGAAEPSDVLERLRQRAQRQRQQ
jgi:hypothetical protein